LAKKETAITIWFNDHCFQKIRGLKNLVMAYYGKNCQKIEQG